MITSKKIRVRYRKEDGSLSRPHTLRMVTYENGDTTYTTMNQNRKIDPDSFVTKWEAKIPVHKVNIKQEDTTEVIRVKFFNEKKQKYYRPVRIVKITKESGDIEYSHLPIGCSKRLDPKVDNFITEWEHGETPVPSPKILGRSFTAKDISKLVRNGFAKTREESKELLEQYEHISKVPGYSASRQQKRGVVKNLATSVNGTGLSLEQLGFKHISKKQPNLREMLKARVEKKYVYLRQSLGNKEITQSQFDILAEAFIPIEFRETYDLARKIKKQAKRDRAAIRKEMKLEGTVVNLPLIGNGKKVKEAVVEVNS